MAAPAAGAERRSESTDPVLVEVTRGEVVENRHRGEAAACRRTPEELGLGIERQAIAGGFDIPRHCQ